MATDELSLGQTGLASSLRVWYFDPAGNVLNHTTGLAEVWVDANYAHYQVGAPATPEAVSEAGTTGRYEWQRPAAVDAWGGTFSFEVHQTVGGTPSTDPLVGEGFEEAEGVTPQPGPSIPQTRTLSFVYGDYEQVTSAVLSDPTGTWGAQRIDTEATVVADGTPMVEVAQVVGATTKYRYEYEITETGLSLRYYVEYEKDGTPGRSLNYSIAPRFAFGSVAEMDSIRGQINRIIGGNKNATASYTETPESTASAEYALTVSNSDIQLAWDFRLNSLGATLSELAGLTIPAHLRTWLDRTASMGAVYFNDEGRGFSGDEGNSYKGQLRELYNDYQERLRQIRDGEVLMALETQEGIEPTVAEAGSFEFVPATRTSMCSGSATDENGQPMGWY